MLEAIQRAVAVYIHTYTHPFNGPFSGATQVSRYQKDKTNLNFTEARDSEWQWHQLGRTQVCTSLQTDNHASNQSINQREICRAPLYKMSRSANSSQWYARSKSTLLSRFLNVLVSVMWWRSEGRVFQAAGPQ